MTKENDILLRTLKGEIVERPPVWLMRQAGRILPQYRAIRSKLSGFKALVKNPELAAEVTIQPVDELGVDAAIIFSDILVIPESMGLPYQLVEKVGPIFPDTIKSTTDIERLDSGKLASEKLDYVYQAIERTKKELKGRVPLIGFCGAPWTILCYMIEGKGSKTFSKARRFLYQNPSAAHELLKKITDSSITYLKQKIRSGVDLLQIFDSWAGILSPELYNQFAIPYLIRMCEEIREVPLIVFAKGAWFAVEELATLDCTALGLDWNMEPQKIRSTIGSEVILQGNLDPCALYAGPQLIEAKTKQMLRQFGSRHIANLGHGVYPDTPLENVKCFVQTVKSYRYQI